MKHTTIVPPASISLFVKSIEVFREENDVLDTRLPFFADGCPGIMLQKTTTGLRVHPHQKLMPPFFLYGQTIHPIELRTDGRYELINFQLYPFVMRSFFGLSPEAFNDNCYDLVQIKHPGIDAVMQTLSNSGGTDERVEKIKSLLEDLLKSKKESLDYKMRQVLESIFNTRGQASIRELAEALKLNPRTLERRFRAETGITAKQFAMMIQFQSSLQQLASKQYSQLSDIVYQNGYADQSHFIKVFKAFTGQTPAVFSNQSA